MMTFTLLVLPVLVGNIVAAVRTEPIGENNSAVQDTDNAVYSIAMDNDTDNLAAGEMSKGLGSGMNLANLLLAERAGACDRSKTHISNCQFDISGSETFSITEDTVIYNVAIHCTTSAVSCFILRTGATLTIIESEITGTSNGRFMEMRDSTVVLDRITGSGFGNDGINGGFIYTTNNGYTITITDSEIKENNGYSGGGLFLSGTGQMTISSTVFEGNTAKANGGALYGMGYSGDISVTQWNIKDCTLVRNTAGYYGGVIMAYHITGLVEGSVITANKATTDNGGGFRLNRSTFTFQCCLFASDTAGGVGGALWLQSSSHIKLIKNIFMENTDGTGSNDISSNGPENTISITREAVYYIGLHAAGNSMYAYIPPGEDITCT